MGYIGLIIGFILGLYWDNGKESGIYRGLVFRVLQDPEAPNGPM